MMLHIINQSPLQTTSLETCLQYATHGSDILLIENAVYAAVAKTKSAKQIQSHSTHINFYVLQADIFARGIAEKLIQEIKLIDYNGFVDLVVKHKTNISWR